MIHVLKSTYLHAPDVVEQTRPAHLKFLAAEIEAGRLWLAGRQEDGPGTGEIRTGYFVACAADLDVSFTVDAGASLDAGATA